jgi:hypothetical protein
MSIDRREESKLDVLDSHQPSLRPLAFAPPCDGCCYSSMCIRVARVVGVVVVECASVWSVECGESCGEGVERGAWLGMRLVGVSLAYADSKESKYFIAGSVPLRHCCANQPACSMHPASQQHCTTTT